MDPFVIAKRAAGFAALAVSLSGCQDVQQQAQTAPPPVPVTTVKRATFANSRQQIGYYAALNPDCSPAGYPAVRIDVHPTHGTIQVVEGKGYTSYPNTNQRYNCNSVKSPMMLVFYSPLPNFRGADEATAHVIYPDGGLSSVENPSAWRRHVGECDSRNRDR